MKGVKLLIQWLNIWAEQWHVVKCLYALRLLLLWWFNLAYDMGLPIIMSQGHYIKHEY